MTPPTNTIDAKGRLQEIEKAANATIGISKTARRGNQSLTGHNPYAEKYREAVIRMTVAWDELRPYLEAAALPDGVLETFVQNLEVVRNPKAHQKTRLKAISELGVSIQTKLLIACNGQMIDPLPKSESVLPMDVIRGAGQYFEKLVIQANGCYERGWYDASLVMIRKLFESLIIAVYETHRVADEIKTNGEFLQLKQLVDKINAETKHWNLGRDTKPALREIREDGNRAAHTRRFNIVKTDIDRLLKGVRVAAEDLIHLSDLKKQKQPGKAH